MSCDGKPLPVTTRFLPVMVVESCDVQETAPSTATLASIFQVFAAVSIHGGVPLEPGPPGWMLFGQR